MASSVDARAGIGTARGTPPLGWRQARPARRRRPKTVRSGSRARPGRSSARLRLDNPQPTTPINSAARDPDQPGHGPRKKP
jgi:hypothetical protein